jgi:hypothetical protein
VCPRHAEAPLVSLCAGRGPLFRPMNEASRRSRSRHFGLPRHTSSRCDPASFAYTPSASFRQATGIPELMFCPSVTVAVETPIPHRC